MTFSEEFPDYPASDLPVIPEGFVDVSWHNDVCPSFFSKALRLVIWCDFPNPAHREFPDSPRYAIHRADDTGESVGVLWTGDDWQALLAELPKLDNA